jgi:hypothetical protein
MLFLMKVEANGLCNERSKEKEVISAYPNETGVIQAFVADRWQLASKFVIISTHIFQVLFLRKSYRLVILIVP